MNYIMKDCNAFCIAFISLKLLLSKILLVSHFVGEPNYWSVEFHPRNSNSQTFLNVSILLFFLLYLILKDCLCLWMQAISTQPLCKTKWYLLYNKAWDFTNCKPLELGVSLLIHSSILWPFLFTLSRFLRLFAFSDLTFLQYEMMKVDKRRDYIKKINNKEEERKKSEK